MDIEYYKVNPAKLKIFLKALYRAAEKIRERQTRKGVLLGEIERIKKKALDKRYKRETIQAELEELQRKLDMLWQQPQTKFSVSREKKISNQIAPAGNVDAKQREIEFIEVALDELEKKHSQLAKHPKVNKTKIKQLENKIILLKNEIRKLK